MEHSTRGSKESDLVIKIKKEKGGDKWGGWIEENGEITKFFPAKFNNRFQVRRAIDLYLKSQKKDGIVTRISKKILTLPIRRMK